jgi:hypothetical protein
MPRPTKLPLKKQKALQRLQDLFHQPGSKDLLWYHRVGQQVNQLCPADERGYGQNRMESLAEDVGRRCTFRPVFTAVIRVNPFDLATGDRRRDQRHGKRQEYASYGHHWLVLAVDGIYASRNKHAYKSPCIIHFNHFVDFCQIGHCLVSQLVRHLFLLKPSGDIKKITNS